MWLGCLVLGGVFACSVGVASAQALPLVQQGDLTYLGAFRVPQLGQSGDAGSYNYGGTSLSYYPTNDSLFLVGFDHEQYLGEINIPALVNSTDIGSYNIATVRQTLRDPSEGTLGDINPTDGNNKKVGGNIVYGGKLYFTGYSYYDAAGTQDVSHFARPINLATTGQVQGPYQVGTQYPGFVSGYMTPVPAAWQATLGGPVLTGNCCLAIAGVQSNGPAVSVFDPADIGVENPVSATPLVGYPSSHPLGPGWGTTNALYNGTTNIRGVVFPEGTRSVLFFGKHGTGPWCYGAGTSDPDLDGDPVPGEPGVIYCYDPADSSKGTHAYPYRYQVWAYDVDDLVDVRNGVLQQYEPQPYATWIYNLPIGDNNAATFGGAAYDPATDRIYLSQMNEDTGFAPIIHAYRVDVGASDTTPPSAPSNLAVQ